MAGIKRKEAPRAVAVQTLESKKKQKLATSGGAQKKHKGAAAKVVSESEQSEDDDDDDDEDDDLDMLDGQDIQREGSDSDMDDGSGSDAGGVDLRGENKASKRDTTGADGDKNKFKGKTPSQTGRSGNTKIKDNG